MASSETEICNLAISHLNIGEEIANLETEKSADARACRRFYTTARDRVLRDFPWPFATKFVALALIEEDPTTEWGFSYRYPTDCLFLRRFLSGDRNDTRQSRVPSKIGQDDAGVLIYTDIADAEIEYTVREENPIRMPPDFVMALSFLIASLIAPRITGGDPFKVGLRAYQLYLSEIARAQANSANEQQDDEPPQSELIRARE